MDKKIRCPRCGGEHLQFVNVPVSVKGDCEIIMIFQVIAYVVSIAFFILGVITQPTEEQILFDKIPINLLLIIIAFILLSEGITLTIIKYFVPYKNKNEIHYVCENCGNNDNLDTLTTE